MERAYLLKTEILRELLPSGKIGVYILGNYRMGKFIPIYVGRSDSCLLRRLMTHNHREKATHVVWRFTTNLRQAFYQECCLYHTYEDEGFLNHVHPASPKNSGLICPICSYTDIDVQILNK